MPRGTLKYAVFPWFFDTACGLQGHFVVLYLPVPACGHGPGVQPRPCPTAVWGGVGQPPPGR